MSDAALYHVIRWSVKLSGGADLGHGGNIERLQRHGPQNRRRSAAVVSEKRFLVSRRARHKRNKWAAAVRLQRSDDFTLNVVNG